MILGIYFSPCGSTQAYVQRVCERLSDRLGLPYRLQSYTLPHERNQWQAIMPDDIVVWGTPTYAGRIPNKTLDFLNHSLIGQGNPVAILSTFGNRSSDHTLLEMLQILDKGNMHAIGFASIATRHVFAPSEIAPQPSYEVVDRWADRLYFHATARYSVESSSLPYYTPLKADGAPAKFLKAKPCVAPSRCSGCGHCSQVCPMGVIQMADNRPRFTDPCIKCQACILGCPNQALAFPDTDFQSHVEMLKLIYASQQGFTFCHAAE